MNKFKIGDKVKVKEKFWEIESYIFIYGGMKKLAGITREVSYVNANGNIRTKQDDSSDDTRWTWDKNWLELYIEPRKEITWETLKWKDVLVSRDGNERMVLGVLNDLVIVSYADNYERVCSPSHKQELKNLGFTIKQATPTVEKEKNTTDLHIESTIEEFDKSIKELESEKEKHIANIKRIGIMMGVPCSEKFGVDVTNIKIKK